MSPTLEFNLNILGMRFCRNFVKICQKSAHEHKDTYASLSSKHNLSASIAKTFHFNLH